MKILTNFNYKHMYPYLGYFIISSIRKARLINCNVDIQTNSLSPSQ